MEAAVAALEAAAKRTTRAASAAKEAAVAASAAATEAAGVATAAKEAFAAAMTTAEQAAAASSTAKETAMAAEAAAKEAAADAAATAKELAAAMRYSRKRSFQQIDDGGSGGGDRADGGNLDLISASPTRSSAASAPSSTNESAAAAAEAAMELAAMRYSKKSRLHQIDNGGSSSGSRDDRGNLDLISTLTDKVLCSIISLLPTKDGARTQAISRQWRPLWRSAPLNLVVKFEYGTKNTKLIALISKILSEHRGHAGRFSLELFNRTDVPVHGWECKIDGWLRSQALDSLQELDFTYTLDMPLSVFSSAPTLCIAKCSYCIFPESFSMLRLNFPCLKQLTLHMVTITDDGLHSILSGCTVLESLELMQIYGIGGLCISSQTLRSIAFSVDCNEGVISQLVIKDAPSLERLLPLYPDKGPRIIRVIRAPKLEKLGLLSEGISKFQFGTTIFQKMIAVSLTTKIHTMKVLFLDSIGPNLEEVVGFLKCFPCLETLYVISHQTKDVDNERSCDPLDPVECLKHHLTKVVLVNYDGTKRPYVNFAKFFIVNTKSLKEMEIKVLNDRNEEWMAKQRRQLCVESRGDAQIELKISTKIPYVDVDTHDLSMADPWSLRR